jgi:hypothetical protein
MADANPEIIEFNVELNTVPNFEGQANDITMNWKFLSGFELGKSFWTDGNGLQMTEKKIVELEDKR